MRSRKRRWIARVQSTSDALDLESGVFRKESPHAMARSLLRSVKQSRRRKGTLLSSGISMLNYYANRAGSKLSPERRQTLQAAKEEYRRLVQAAARRE